MIRSIIHLFVEFNCFRLTNFSKCFNSVPLIRPDEMTTNDSLRENSNFFAIFWCLSLYEIAPNGVVLFSHQSIHREMNNNQNRSALRYRWWQLAFKCPSFHICIEMVIEPFDGFGFHIAIIQSKTLESHKLFKWKLETGTINTSINGHVVCLELLINQSRLRSCHYEWVIIW